MSGSIRQILGPAKSRIKKLISKEAAKVDLPAEMPLDVALSRISATRIKIHFDIDKLQCSLGLLIAKDRDWCAIIENPQLPEEKRSAEQKLYSEAVEDPQGHWACIMAAQDRLSELKSMILELDFMQQSTQAKIDSGIMAASVPTAAAQPPTPSPPRQPQLKLPKVELPKFNGDLSGWKAFWDLFSSAVDSQPIPDVQKFSYLSASLTGVAASAIKGLALTEINYLVAVGLLKDRFGDNSAIIRSLYSQLRNLQSPGNNTKDLRKFLDSME
ncbi:MAG: DUF1759 domain-containing protein, partial [Gammaproteobacteria bacterium]|nr:DUF1759 domain-containing protein [Gammaproteobacteria bacterium]